jgi:hypothetical protein
MSVKSQQQVIKDPAPKRAQATPAVISRVRGFSGNHTMRTLTPSGIPMKSHTPHIQPKLIVNTPGDRHEQEADRVAERVLRMPGQSLQRGCACGGGCPRCKNSEQRVQRPPVASTITPFIHANAGGVASDSILNSIASRGNGRELPDGPRKFMESRFGTDFSGVRVHTDAKAGQLSQELGAQAFTVGNHVYFNSGKFTPASSDGRRLLAHELTHTVQQRAIGPQLSKSIQRQAVIEAEEENKDESFEEELSDIGDDAIHAEDDISEDCIEHTKKPKPSTSAVSNRRKGLSWGHRMRKHQRVNKHFSGGGLIGLLGGTKGKYRRHRRIPVKDSPKSTEDATQMQETKEVAKQFQTLTASDSSSISAHLDTSPDVFGGSTTPGHWAENTIKKTHHDSDLEGVFLVQPDPVISMPPCSKVLSSSANVSASGTFSYRLGSEDYTKKTSSIYIRRSDDGGTTWSEIWKVENTSTRGDLRTVTLANLQPGKYDIVTTYDDWVAGHTHLAYDFQATIQSVKTAKIVITKIKYVWK